jgi:hypothetical protein
MDLRMVLGFTKNSLRFAIKKSQCYYWRLFLASLYCFLMFSCGKKAQLQEEANNVQTPALDSNVIQLRSKIMSFTGTTIDEQLYFEQNSEVRLPLVIQVEKGTPSNKFARLYFNVDENSNFSFYCNYYEAELAQTATGLNSQQINNTHLYFDRCFTQEGNLGEINYYPGYEAIQFRNRSVQFRLLGATPTIDTTAVAELEIINR